MITTSLTHALIALGIQLPFSLMRRPWMGAVAAIGYYWGREAAQAQRAQADADGAGSVIGYGYLSLRPDKWSRDGMFDLALPALAVIVMAFAVTWYLRKRAIAR